MAATHAITKMLIHHSTCCVVEVGWGSNAEAVYADAMESAMGMANAAAETRKPARERASHRLLRCSSVSPDMKSKPKTNHLDIEELDES
jgi:hypothetical protein